MTDSDLRSPADDRPPRDDQQGLLPAVEVGPDGECDGAVIWLHGLGANGYDFAPIPPELQLPEEQAWRFVFPHAPEIPVTLNMGMVMPAWYDITSLDSRGQDEARIRRNAQRVRDLIAREMGRGLPAHRIFLAGFSQGGALALYSALRYPQRLAGLIILSTYLLLPELLTAEASPANRNLPIFQAHGLYDPLVPLDMGENCRDQLENQGYAVEWHSYPMEHQVCLEEIKAIGQWMTTHLASNQLLDSDS